LRLGDIGAGQLADLRANSGRFEFLAEDIFVVAVDREQVLVAHDVEIGLRHPLEHRGLDRQGLRPRCLDDVDGLPQLRLGAAATIDLLRRGQIERGGVAVGIRSRACRRRLGTHAVPGLAGKGDRRPPIRQSLRHYLIGRPQQCPLRQQLRVGAVGLGQCLGQALRRGGGDAAGHRHQQCCDESRHEPPCHRLAASEREPLATGSVPPGPPVSAMEIQVAPGRNG
jgi:hypothetical protein